MPKLGTKKTEEAPEQKAVQAAAPDQPAAPGPSAEGQPPAPAPEGAKEKEAPKTAEPPKESHVLLTILTILLVVLGIVEVILLGYIGYETFRTSQARRAWENQQASSADETETVAARGAFYIGPLIHIENGEVVWRRGDDSYYGYGAGASGSTAGQTGGAGEAGGETTRLANMTVPQIGYRLAQEEDQDLL